MNQGRPRQPDSFYGRIRELLEEDPSLTVMQMYEKLKDEFQGERTPFWLRRRIRQARSYLKLQLAVKRES